MDGRYFGGKQVIAEIYDGKTKYDPKKQPKDKQEAKSASSAPDDDAENEAERLEKYAQWLEAQEEEEEESDGDGDDEERLAREASNGHRIRQSASPKPQKRSRVTEEEAENAYLEGDEEDEE